MADTQTQERYVQPGSEPLRKTPPGDAAINMNPSSKVPHSQFHGLKTLDDVIEVLAAVLSQDFGAARRRAYGDADVGLHDREADEVANPTADLAGLPEGASEQLERHREVNRERAKAKDSQPISGAPRKTAKEDGGVAMSAATEPAEEPKDKGKKDSK